MHSSSRCGVATPWPGARWAERRPGHALADTPAAPPARPVVDASAPWLAHLGPALQPVLADWSAGRPVHQALQRALQQRLAEGTAPPALAAGPLRFVPQQVLPAGAAYEAHIHAQAAVPTRDNLHDLFNGLVWLALPALKRRLNQLQAGEIARQGVRAQRGPLRDALTLMDENGALLQAPAVLWQALRQRDWSGLFVRHRALWAQARLTLVGHALIEQLASAPRKPLTAHVLCADDPLALDEAAWATKPFTPLPVLGVPGWWPANQDPAFYDDVAVFRPLRSRSPAA